MPIDFFLWTDNGLQSERPVQDRSNVFPQRLASEIQLDTISDRVAYWYKVSHGKGTQAVEFACA